MAVEIAINSWFVHGAGNNEYKKVMATNDFLSLSQSIWFYLIHVLLVLIFIVDLFFLFIWMKIQINKISFIYFL